MTRNHQTERPTDAVLRAMDAAARAYIANACCTTGFSYNRMAAQFEVPDGSWGATHVETHAADQMWYGFWAARAIPPAAPAPHPYGEETYERDKAELEGRLL